MPQQFFKFKSRATKVNSIYKFGNLICDFLKLFV